MIDSLINSLYKIGAIQFGEFKLKSGKTSHIYINLRKIISYPNILTAIADAMWEITKGYRYDLICGVPYTALPIATCISINHHIPMVMRRKEKKDYGTKQLIEGDFKAGQRVLVIEDVVTTGGSILETTRDLESAGLKVENLVALIDREQGGKENLEQKYKLDTLINMSSLLRSLSNSSLLSNEERHTINQFLSKRVD